MDGKTLARLGAVVFVAVAITATAIELNRKDEPPLYRGLPAINEMADPLKAELRRCQQLGEAGTRDTSCLRAWAQNRDRFLAPSQPILRQEAPQAPGPQGTPQNPQGERDPVLKDTAPAPQPQPQEAR